MLCLLTRSGNGYNSTISYFAVCVLFLVFMTEDEVPCKSTGGNSDVSINVKILQLLYKPTDCEIGKLATSSQLVVAGYLF